MEQLIQDSEVEGEAKLKQFALVSDWLSKHNLLKTLDTLLEEYNEVLEAELVPAQKNIKIIEKQPISELKHTFSHHKGSVLSVNFHPFHPWLISTDSSKLLVLSSLTDGAILSSDRTNNPFMGAIISVHCNPKHPHLLLIGTMDERHALLEIVVTDKGEEKEKVSVKTLQMWHLHKKYVIRVKWHPDGEIFATASHDGSVAFFKLGEGGKEAEQVKQLFFEGCVEAIEWTKDGKSLVTSIREEPCLHYIKIDTWEILLVNSNVLADGHVSFAILELKNSPDGKQILACTDHSRSILFQLGTPVQVRNFYGFENDGYSQPRSVFDNNGLIYLTSQDNHVYVFDVTTGKLVQKFLAHASTVRDIDYSLSKDLIATSSYDKTIKIWERKPPTTIEDDD